MFDVLIIGAGVTGCAAARELSKYKLSVCVAERESDLCEGTSKANSAIVHAGFDAEPGTLKARFNVRGNLMIPELSRKLDFAFKNNGALVLCFDEEQLPELRRLLEKGEENGVQGLRIMDKAELKAFEPAVSDEAVAALYAPTSGIVCPFEMTAAFAENAAANGAQFYFSTEVKSIDREDGLFLVRTDRGTIKARAVINTAGVYADKIHSMVSSSPMKIIPRKGEYMLLDKEAGGIVKNTIFQLPTKMGKGILVSPTVHGNLIVGPTAQNIEDKEDTSTTRSGLNEARAKGLLSVADLPFNKVITSFTGLRAVGDTHDFIIGETEVPGFIDAAGIESPGLTSAPAIAEYLAELVGRRIELVPKEDFIDTRKGVVHLKELPPEEQSRLIKENPAYGNIVCRCEQVTEGEILDAINRPLGARTLDGVKRRTRAGMGRCQAGFCSPKAMALIAEKLGIGIGDVRKNGAFEEDGGEFDA
ncbi:MAG: NAD(P)/FAD-dependent oxidoreductase [Ruminococcus sp.]|nr:NAD(P)/FAD-dependent oxidoreductase [Ruminococcus sp.]